jgi:hypothetical protein
MELRGGAVEVAPADINAGSSLPPPGGRLLLSKICGGGLQVCALPGHAYERPVGEVFGVHLYRHVGDGPLQLRSHAQME